jgi:3-hydroxyisobutyrate dehydrogenase-like beta-hydroxyacid dehydrogenase
MAIKLSLLGLGIMGRPMSRTLIKGGVNVFGWNRSILPDNLTTGIPLCRHIEEAAQADICLLMLQDSVAVNAVLDQLLPHLSAGQLVLDMGSSDPTHSRNHAKELDNMGIGWVDAPVSGGPEGAALGTLSIMAGGTKAHVDRVRPFLEVLGTNIVHVGGPGMGHMVKIVNQMIVGLTIEAVAEGLTLAEKSGIDPEIIQKALKGGFADSKILQLHGYRMAKRQYVPGGKIKSQLKDLKLARRMAEKAGVKLPHLESTIQFYKKLVAQGHADMDHSALHKLLW